MNASSYLRCARDQCQTRWGCSGHFEICLCAEDICLFRPMKPWGAMNKILKSLSEAVKPDGEADASRSKSIQQQACWIKTLYSDCVCVYVCAWGSETECVCHEGWGICVCVRARADATFIHFTMTHWQASIRSESQDASEWPFYSTFLDEFIHLGFLQ